MATSTGIQLAQSIRRSIEELKRVCEGLEETTASRAPKGRWSPKEILSHLCGPEGSGHLPILQAFLDRETPKIDIEAENPFFTEKRARMSFAQLLSAVDKEYERISEFTKDLSVDQLDRKAHIPLFKESPFGEYPTLQGLIEALGQSHVQFHINHMREILQSLGAGSKVI
jgi:hypothetical protein